MIDEDGSGQLVYQDLRGVSNNPRSAPEAEILYFGSEESVPREPSDVFYNQQYGGQNSAFASPVDQSGGLVPFQNGQSARNHPYYPSSSGPNRFIPAVHSGQVAPPQYGESYSAPGEHTMPNIAFQPNQNPYLQPYNQSFNGIGQPARSAYANGSNFARVTEVDSRFDNNRIQSTVRGFQRATLVQSRSYDDETELIWPSHLSDEERHARGIYTREERHARGIYTREERREFGMVRLAQITSPTPQRRRRTGPAANRSPEYPSTAPAGGFNQEATNPGSANHLATIDLTSDIDDDPEDANLESPAVAEPTEVGLVHTKKGKTGRKRAGSQLARSSRAGSQLARSSRAAPKRPRIFHGELHHRPDGTVWFRAPGSDVSGKLTLLSRLLASYQLSIEGKPD